MALVSLEPSELKRLVRQRRVTGAGRFDEVWDGVYVMAPLADNEHQRPGAVFSGVLGVTFQLIPGIGRPQIEIVRSSPPKQWQI